MLDTGCMADHKEIRARVASRQAFPKSRGTTDGNGHGTHTAALAAGVTSSTAKMATLICVKVFSDGGSGSVSSIIAGIHYAIKRRRKLKRRPSLIVIAAAGPPNAGLDAAVSGAIRKGIHVVVAAGNGGSDASLNSPARVRTAIAVGATDMKDAVARFSNTGPAVALFAPGQDIESAYIGSPFRTATLSGTSMSAPIVASVLANLISVYGDRPPAVWKERLINATTRGAIASVPAETPNRILFNAWNATDVTRCWAPWTTANQVRQASLRATR